MSFFIVDEITHLVAVGCSSIVDQYIQASKFGECQIDHSLPIVRLCHVHTLKDQVGGVLRGDFLTTLDIDVGDDDFGTFFTKSTGDGSTETGATSCENGLMRVLEYK